MKELNQKLRDLTDEVNMAEWQPEQVREIAKLALAALTEIATLPELNDRKPGGLTQNRVGVPGLHKDIYKALDTRTPEEKLEERIRAAVTSSVCNALNYPTDIGSKILGRDMSAVVKKTSDAVLEVLFAESAKTEPVPEKTQYRAVWASGSALDPDTEEGARKMVEAWKAGWVEYKAPGGSWCKL